MTTGVDGSLLAMAWVIFIARPKEVSTTSAPSSCASLATWKAIEESLRTPVTSSFLPCNNMTSFREIKRQPVLSGSASVTHAKAAVNRDDGAGDVGRVL